MTECTLDEARPPAGSLILSLSAVKPPTTCVGSSSLPAVNDFVEGACPSLRETAVVMLTVPLIVCAELSFLLLASLSVKSSLSVSLSMSILGNSGIRSLMRFIPGSSFISSELVMVNDKHNSLAIDLTRPENKKTKKKITQQSS